MSDFYLVNPAELHGKPKTTISEYVRQNGILVPRRFATLDEALSSGIPIIARSEHPQDYDGVSEVLESIVLQTRKKINEDALLRTVLKNGNYKKYCALLGIAEPDFIADVGVSYWQKIDGVNLTIAADNAISNKYHVIARLPVQKGGMSIYYLSIENRRITRKEGPKGTLGMNLDLIVQVYEQIRTLHNFDPNHCPIVEAQYFENSVYFLQYHRGRDFEPSQFKLGGNRKINGSRANFVRGTSMPGGSYFDVVIWHGSDCSLRDEDGAHDEPDNKMFTEIMTRRRKVELFETSKNYGIALHLDAGHVAVSRLFKPNISLGIPAKEFFKLIPRQEYRHLMAESQKTKIDQIVRFHIVSDGRKAYISRI